MPKKTKTDRLVIPYDFLNDRLKEVLDNVRGQRIGRVAGLILYPTLGAVGALTKNPVITSFALLTPFCVGLHQMGTVFSSKAAGEVLRKGVIVDSQHERPEWKLNSLRKNFTHFYVDKKRNIVFVNEPSKGFFKRLFRRKRMPLEEPVVKDGKGWKFLRRLFADSVNSDRVNYNHLDSEVRKQVDEVIKSRRKRFRRTLSMVIAGPLLYGLKSTNVAELIGMAGVGAGIGLIVSYSEASHETKRLWEIIDKKKNLVAPEFREKYGMKKVAKGKSHLKLTFFGNIKPVKRKWLAFRKTHKMPK